MKKLNNKEINLFIENIIFEDEKYGHNRRSLLEQEDDTFFTLPSFKKIKEKIKSFGPKAAKSYFKGYIADLIVNEIDLAITKRFKKPLNRKILIAFRSILMSMDWVDIKSGTSDFSIFLDVKKNCEKVSVIFVASLIEYVKELIANYFMDKNDTISRIIKDAIVGTFLRNESFVEVERELGNIFCEMIRSSDIPKINMNLLWKKLGLD